MLQWYQCAIKVSKMGEKGPSFMCEEDLLGIMARSLVTAQLYTQLVFSDTLYVLLCLVVLPILFMKRISGYTRIECQLTSTTLSKWKSALKTACTLNSSITSPSK